MSEFEFERKSQMIDILVVLLRKMQSKILFRIGKGFKNIFRRTHWRHSETVRIPSCCRRGETFRLDLN